MQAEVIAVGSELLLGQIVDTNSAFIARELAALGLDLYFKTTVGDNLERLEATLVTTALGVAGGVDIVPATVVAGGNAEFGISWVPKALASRESALSSCASVSSCGILVQRSQPNPIAVSTRNTRKKYPTLDWVNECTLEMIPLRVMNVPKIDSMNDSVISDMFHFFSMPRFS